MELDSPVIQEHIPMFSQRIASKRSLLQMQVGAVEPSRTSQAVPGRPFHRQRRRGPSEPPG